MGATLQAYKDREGDCLVPDRFMTPDGFTLVNWVMVQRRTKDAILPERRQRLDALGFVWDPFEDAWERGFAALQTYKDREGDCLVSQRLMTPDGFNLGKWVSTQRKTNKALLPERRQRLNALGFVWDARRRK